jgi:hypothetical protein
MGERVLHRAGDALTADLDQTPTISSLAHSLSTTSPTSRTEPSRPGWPAHAPGGVDAILDVFRPRSAKDAGQLGALLEFYFVLTSQAGTWPVEEISD